jgi:hypothetical protein
MFWRFAYGSCIFMCHRGRRRRICANGVVQQIGEAQTGYVGDAADDTDVERGMLCHYLQFLQLTDYPLQQGHGRGWKKWPK